MYPLYAIAWILCIAPLASAADDELPIYLHCKPMSCSPSRTGWRKGNPPPLADESGPCWDAPNFPLLASEQDLLIDANNYTITPLQIFRGAGFPITPEQRELIMEFKLDRRTGRYHSFYSYTVQRPDLFTDDHENIDGVCEKVEKPNTKF
jgi:hypothetical protein